MWRGNEDDDISIRLSGLSSGVLSLEAAARRPPEAEFRPAPLAARTSSASRLCSEVPGTCRGRCFGTPRPAPAVGVPSRALEGPGSDAAAAPSTLDRRGYAWPTSAGALRSVTSPGPDCGDGTASLPLAAVLCLAPILRGVCCWPIFHRIWTDGARHDPIVGVSFAISRISSASARRHVCLPSL